MSGLFRRLAGRALGQPGATQLHALARLPYQATPVGMVEPPAPWTAEPQPAASQQASQYQAAEQQASPRPAPAQTSPGRRTPQAPMTTSIQPQSVAAPGRAAAILEGFEPAVASPFLPAEPRRINSGIQDAPEQTALPMHPAPQPAPLFRPVADKASAPATAASFWRSTNASASLPGRPEQPPESLALPEAVLPPAPLLAPRHDSPTQPVRTAERHRAPDEVHVHIGRIEITAVQPPAPAKRASRKGQAPLSLDDYLARRKGDGA